LTKFVSVLNDFSVFNFVGVVNGRGFVNNLHSRVNFVGSLAVVLCLLDILLSSEENPFSKVIAINAIHQILHDIYTYSTTICLISMYICVYVIAKEERKEKGELY